MSDGITIDLQVFLDGPYCTLLLKTDTAEVHLNLSQDGATRLRDQLDRVCERRAQTDARALRDRVLVRPLGSSSVES